MPRADVWVAGGVPWSGPWRPWVLALLPRLLRRTHLTDARVRLLPCRGAHLESTSPLPVAVDGEYLGHVHRLELSVEAGGLRVVLGNQRSKAAGR